MSNVTVFLRTALFTFGSEQAHVPVGTLVLRGDVADESKGGMLKINVNECLDGRGKVLSDTPVTLMLPMSKVDHLLLAGE